MPDFSDNAPRVEVPCPLCRAGERRRVADTVWGAPGAIVCRCEACGIVFVHPRMSTEEQAEFYAADFAHYMRERGGPGEMRPQEHFEKHQDEALRRLTNLKPYLRADMKVLEVGSSTGFLLEAVRPFVASVAGVEPGRLYASYAAARGIRTYPDLLAIAKEQFDLMLAYYVVEHLQNPIEQLRRFRAMLRPGGLMAIEVPNVNDVLVSLYQVEAFDRFYWQKAHCFNYSRATLRTVLERAGFTGIVTAPQQRYDISNHLYWLLKGRPGGQGKYATILDEQLNAEYARCLKRHWLCDTIFALAVKR
jgi:2-polyprenyl-3-methyl-5-hydroxy-6-metoxy-1,4-benzoquinol methylase